MKNLIISMACAIAAAIAVPPAAANQTTPAAQPAAKPATPALPRVPMTRYTMTAGDFIDDEEGISESIVYDTDSKALRVISYTGPAPVQTMGIFVKDVVTKMTAADVDGDGNPELITGEGLLGYNPKEGPQTD